MAAQVNLYAAEEEQAALALQQVRSVFEKHGLEAEPGAVSTHITGEDATIFAALQEAYDRVTGQGGVMMVSTFSEVPQREFITCRAIGRVNCGTDGHRVVLDYDIYEAHADVLAPGGQLALAFHVRDFVTHGRPSPVVAKTATIIEVRDNELQLEDLGVPDGALLLDLQPLPAV